MHARASVKGGPAAARVDEVGDEGAQREVRDEHDRLRAPRAARATQTRSLHLLLHPPRVSSPREQTRRMPPPFPPVLTGYASSLPPYKLDTPRPSPRTNLPKREDTPQWHQGARQVRCKFSAALRRSTRGAGWRGGSGRAATSHSGAPPPPPPPLAPATEGVYSRDMGRGNSREGGGAPPRTAGRWSWATRRAGGPCGRPPPPLHIPSTRPPTVPTAPPPTVPPHAYSIIIITNILPLAAARRSAA